MTPGDCESVEHAGRALHGRGWRKKFSVNEMTDAWRRLVAEVEAGYDQPVCEYTNDLSCRDWLALAWPDRRWATGPSSRRVTRRPASGSPALTPAPAKQLHAGANTAAGQG